MHVEGALVKLREMAERYITDILPREEDTQAMKPEN